MNPGIIFEDDSILVIDKPIGISVTPENNIPENILDWVKKRYSYSSSTNGAEDEFEQRYGVVHRLDKETSGILIIAKNKEIYQFLKGLFKFRRLQKEYQVLVYGHPKDDRFEISAPIDRNTGSGVTYMVEEGGREAVTEFQTIERLTLSENSFKASYLKAFPKTGRTHQIRVHLKALGHPVVNDTKYANRSLLEQSKDTYRRMMLHAYSITFTDWNGDKRVFTSPLDLSTLFIA